MTINEIKVYTKIGEETGRKLYSCDKQIWFGSRWNAVAVHEDRLKREAQLRTDGESA